MAIPSGRHCLGQKRRVRDVRRIWIGRRQKQTSNPPLTLGTPFLAIFAITGTPDVLSVRAAVEFHAVNEHSPTPGTEYRSSVKTLPLVP